MEKELLKKWWNRSFSWSQMASFEYDPEAWFKRYILGEKEPENEVMKFGKHIGGKLATDPLFLPEVPRLCTFEHELRGKIGKIKLVSFLDSFCIKDKDKFKEYKTSSNKTKWTQKSSTDHGQMLFYKFMLWLNYSIKPEEIDSELVYIPVEEDGSFKLKLSNKPIQIFKVKHTAVDVLKFASYIQDIHKKMEEYAKKRLAQSIASSKIEVSSSKT